MTTNFHLAVWLLAACLGLSGAAHSAAPAAKTLRVYVNTSESGIDPAAASDISTLSLVENVFDPLLRYDYLR